MSDEPEPGEDVPQSESQSGCGSEDETGRDDDGRSPGLRRTRYDRYLGGVAGGAGRLFDVDPLVFRVAFAVGTVWWRATPLLYAVLWLTVREEGAERSLLASASRAGGLRRVASVVALGLGAFAVGPRLSAGGSGEVRLGLLFLAAGAILILGGGGGLGPDPVPAEPSSGAGAAPTTGDSGPRRPLGSFVSGPGAGAPGRGRRSRLVNAGEPRDPARLGWLGFWLVVLAGGAALALDRADAGIRPGVLASLALLVVAVCLLVGAVRGRARLLIPVGALLAPLWLGFSVGAVPRYGGDGRATYTPGNVAQIDERYTHGYGRLRLDLTEVAWDGGETTDVELGLTGGVVEVWLPSDVDVQLDAAVGIGDGEVVHRWEGSNAVTLDRIEPDLWLGHGTVSLDSPARPPTCDTFYEPVEPVGDPRRDGEPGPVPSPPQMPGQGAQVDDEPQGEPVHRDPDGRPCSRGSAPENPAVVKLDVQIGIGHVEVRHVQTPA